MQIQDLVMLEEPLEVLNLMLLEVEVLVEQVLTLMLQVVQLEE